MVQKQSPKDKKPDHKVDNNNLSLTKIIPNFVTLASLCIALTAILHCLNNKFIEASAFILFAGLMDGLDGRLARYLNSSSEYGAQLDSLVDFANFSIVPGIVIFLWIQHLGFDKNYSWFVVLFYALCGVTRLARFNVGLNDNNKSILDEYFFKGIPAPVGAMLSMMPIILVRQYGDGFYSNPIIIMVYIITIGVLMASTVPTISLKKVPIKNEYFYLTFLTLGLIIIGLLLKPWFTLSILCLIYVLSIPIGLIIYLKLQFKHINE